VLFYVLLGGQAPFRGRPEAIMHDVCYHDPAPPSEADPMRRWAKYDPIVARAIAKSPENRFATAGEFRAAILAEYARPVSESISESTIIRHPVRPTPSTGESSAPLTQKTSAISTGGTAPPPGWEVAVLAGVEMELARYVGPVAKVLVRRAARQHKNLPALVAAVAVSIDSETERHAFARAVTGRGLQPVPTLVPAEGTDSSLGETVMTGPAMSDQDLEKATRLLTTFIGPIARVVAKRAAGPNVSRRDFFARVAQSLDSEAQRERFLREAGIGRL
jgi:serine/threonine-protein kinase